MAHPRRFSDDEELRMVSMYTGGASTTAVAKAFGCQSSRVGIILERRGVPRRETKRFDPATRAEIAARYMAGESTTALAKAFRVKHPTIANALKYEGVTLRCRVDQAKNRTGHCHPNYAHGRRCGDSHYKRTAPTVLPNHCERCGATDRLVVHHRNGVHTDNRPENWERLCQTCHAKHHEYWKRRKSCA